MTSIKVAFAQTNPVVGDVSHNLEQLLKFAELAAGNTDVLVSGELALSGYPLGDLSYREDVIDQSKAAVTKLVAASSEPKFSELYFVVGHATMASTKLTHIQSSKAIAHNSASVIHNGELIGTYHKQILPNYDVFDDWRNFVPGNQELFFDVRGTTCALAICEDIWDASSIRPAALRAAGVELLIVPNGSPYTRQKPIERRLAAAGFQDGFALAYANLSGGQDELVFDGGSFLLDSSGSEIQRAPFEEGCFWERNQDLAAIAAGDLATLWRVLVTGLRDYCRKTGQTKLLIGLSGGIDSALAAAIAVEAIGAANVIGVALPSRFSSEHSIDDAKQLAANLKMEIRQIPIEPVHKAFESAMRFSDLAGENLQARIRAVLLMGISNSENALLLSTGNKSEIAVGYSTMYGDSAGGFAPIKDLFKTDVWKVSRWLNERGDKELIPSNSITKEPSAELRAEQVDTDSLPDYQVLDEVLALLIEQSATIEQVVAQGHNAELVERIEALVRASEWKRSQGAIGTKTTSVAFGTGRRVPLTTRFTKL